MYGTAVIIFYILIIIIFFFSMQKYSTRPEGNDAGKQNLSSREQSVSPPAPRLQFDDRERVPPFPFSEKIQFI